MTWKVIGIRRSVQREMAQTGLPEPLLKEFHALSEWLHMLPTKFGGRVSVRLIDAASVEGFFKSLVRWLRRYPAFLVDGERYTGTDFTQVDALISRHLSALTTSQG